MSLPTELVDPIEPTEPDEGAVRVVLIAAAAPVRPALEAPVLALTALGARVNLLFLSPPSHSSVLSELPLSGYRRLIPTRWTTAVRPPRYSPRWVIDTATYRIGRLAAYRAPAPRRIARALRRDPQARELVAAADVLVALDRIAVHPVWRAARRGRRPAFLGAPAAVRHVEEMLRCAS